MRIATAAVPLLAVLSACASAGRSEGDLEAARSYVEEARDAEARGDREAALDLYASALDAHPEYPQAYFGRANIRVDLRLDPDAQEPGRRLEEEALRDYAQAIRYNPAYADAYFNRAMLLASRARYKPAVRDLLNASRFNPDDPEPHLWLGRLYEEKFEDRQLDALRHYEQYVDLGGPDEKVRETVRLWKELKRQAEAPPPDRAPTEEEEQAAAALYAEFRSRMDGGDRDGALRAMKDLLGRYAHTQFVRGKERALHAILRALEK